MFSNDIFFNALWKLSCPTDTGINEANMQNMTMFASLTIIQNEVEESKFNIRPTCTHNSHISTFGNSLKSDTNQDLDWPSWMRHGSEEKIIIRLPSTWLSRSKNRPGLSPKVSVRTGGSSRAAMFAGNGGSSLALHRLTNFLEALTVPNSCNNLYYLQSVTFVYISA